MSTNNNNTKTYKLLPKQMEFVQSTEKEVLLSGGWGSSKSTALCLAVLKQAATYTGGNILLARKQYTALRRSTLQTLIGNEQPILPLGSYNYNKVQQVITLNGSNTKIWTLGLDDMEKIRSMNLSFIAVDEVSELEEKDWIELMGRARNEHGSRQIVGATNPASPSHWLYQRFFVNIKQSRKVIRSTSLDNPFLPQDYLESLKEMPKDLYNRFVLGEWVALENVIYSQFRRERHLKHRDYGEFVSYYLGVDFGFTNPCAICLMGVDGDKNIHLIECIKESKLLIGKIVELCEEYKKFEPKVIVDPSAPALIAEFEQDGFNVHKADNSVDAGIARFQNYLSNNKFSSEEGNLEFIQEIENYIYDMKGKPNKTNDHILDAVRYCLNDIVEDEGIYFKPVVYMGDEE